MQITLFVFRLVHSLSKFPHPHSNATLPTHLFLISVKVALDYLFFVSILVRMSVFTFIVALEKHFCVDYRTLLSSYFGDSQLNLPIPPNYVGVLFVSA